MNPSSAKVATRSWWARLRKTPLADLVRGRFPGSLDLSAAIAEVALPAPLADLAQTVARRTRLWRVERVDVARELAEHFRDGLSSGQTVEQLVASFGDVGQVALLMRRAKLRARPLFWRLWRRDVQALSAVAALAVGCYLFLVVFGETAADVAVIPGAEFEGQLSDYEVSLSGDQRKMILEAIGGFDVAAMDKAQLDLFQAELADPESAVRLRGFFELMKTPDSLQMFADLSDHPDAVLRFISNLPLVNGGDGVAANAIFDVIHSARPTRQQKQLIKTYCISLGIDPAADSPDSIYDLMDFRRAGTLQLKPGDTAPLFEATDATGKAVRLEDLNGKVVLLHFWSTSCRSCLANMPALRKELSAYPAEGLAVISVSLDEDRLLFNEAIKQHDPGWISVFDGGGWGGKLARAYGVRQLPLDVVVDRGGVVKSYDRDAIPQILAAVGKP